VDWLEQLVEVRMRDWERRVREGTAPPPPEGVALGEGLEVTLWREIVALRQIATERPPGPEREAAVRRSADLEVQLWLLLERSGRPLAAARLQHTLRAMR
jgi:hypothetical protein